MRIFYYGIIPTEQSQGPTVRVHETCKYLSCTDEVLAVLPRARSTPFPFQFNVLFLPFFGFSFSRLCLYYLTSALSLFIAIIKFKPDVIYDIESLNPFCGLLASLFRIPYVIELNGFAIEDFKKVKTAPLVIMASKLLQTFAFKRAKGLVGSTPGVLSYVKPKVCIPEDRICYIDSGVDLEKFMPLDKEYCRAKLEMDFSNYCLGFVGTLHLNYDYKILLELLFLLNSQKLNVKLIIVGDEANIDYHKKLALESGVEHLITFTGDVPHEMIPYYIGSFDICLLPMTRERISLQNGAYAMKLYEYLACEKIIIATDMEGTSSYSLLKEMVEIVPPESPQAIADVVTSYIANPTAYDKKKKRGREYVEKYRSWRSVSNELHQFLSHIIEKTDA